MKTIQLVIFKFYSVRKLKMFECTKISIKRNKIPEHYKKAHTTMNSLNKTKNKIKQKINRAWIARAYC